MEKQPSSRALQLLCSKCKSPLYIPLQYNPPPQLPELSLSDFHSSNELLSLSSHSLLKLSHDSILPKRSKDAINTDKKESNPTDFDKQVNAIQKILEVASDKCQLEHPICSDCFELLSSTLQDKIQEMQSEKAIYQQKLSTLIEQSDSTSKSLIDTLSKEEEELYNKLSSLVEENESVEKELSSVNSELKRIDILQSNFEKKYSEFFLKNEANKQTCTSLSNLLSHLNSQLEHLRSTNIYNGILFIIIFHSLIDVFHIYYDGHYGTINGFRMGIIQPNSWNEINAGFGQICLLLETIANILHFHFTKYKIIPLGSFSRIMLNEETFELYGSDSNLGRIWWNKRFNNGLIGLLYCINELGDYCSNKDSNFKLKYPIVDDKINDVSIKLTFHQEEIWTKALKYLLTNLKYLLAWTSKQN